MTDKLYQVKFLDIPDGKVRDGVFIPAGWTPLSGDFNGVWVYREVAPEVSEAIPDPRPMTAYERQQWRLDQIKESERPHPGSEFDPRSGTWKSWS